MTKNQTKNEPTIEVEFVGGGEETFLNVVARIIAESMVKENEQGKIETA